MCGCARSKLRRWVVGLAAVALVVAGCSGRTTGATNIEVFESGPGGPPPSASAQLNAIGSCRTSCTVFIRWRAVGASTWTNEPATSVGRVRNAPYSVTVSNLSPFTQYEYQVCGKEASWSGFVCVGPDGTPMTTQKFATIQGSGDWPAFRYDYFHSGSNPFEFTIDASNVSNLVSTWSAPVENPGSPVVGNGLVYVASQSSSATSGTLAAYPAQCRIHGRTCRAPRWTATVGGNVQGSTPAYSLFGNEVVVGAQQPSSGGPATGRIYTYDAATGALLWTGDTGGAIHAAPTFDGSEVLVAADDGFVYAFGGCSSTGGSCAPVWKSQSPFLSGGGTASSSPAEGTGVPNGPVFVGSPDGHVYSFDGTNGALRWVAATGGPIHSSPSVSPDGFVVYVGSDDGKLYAFTAGRVGGADGGQLLFAATTGGAITSSPAFNNEGATPTVVYVGSDDGKLYAFSTACDECTGGGQLLWTGTTGGAIHSSPAVANGVVYVGSDDAKLYAFPADGCGSSSCSPLFVGPAGHPPSSPAVAGGLVYFTGQASGASRLHAYALP